MGALHGILSVHGCYLPVRGPSESRNIMNQKATVQPIGVFNGVALSALVMGDLTYLVASEVSLALGYGRPGRIQDFVCGKWANEFPEPDEVLEPSGKLLTTVKTAFKEAGSPIRLIPLLLSESAVQHVAHLSRLPRAADFGAWLTPALARVKGPDLAGRLADLEQRCERLEAALARLTSQTGQGSGYALADAQGAFCALWSRDLGSVAKTYQEVFRWAEASMERQGLARLVCGSEFKSVAIRNWLKSAVWCSFTAPDGQRYSIQGSDGPRYWVRRD